MLSHIGDKLGLVSRRHRAAIALLLKYVVRLACLAWVGVSLAATNPVDSAARERLYEFDIPAQPLIKSLSAISSQTKTLVLFRYELVENLSGAAVKGRYTVEQVLRLILGNTGLVGGFSNKGVLTISKSNAADREAKRSSSAHNATPQAASPDLSAAHNIINEEVIVTARRRDESAKDVPVAVSVVSADALETQGVRSEGDLQAALPGLIVRSSNNSNQLNYVIRGESVDAYSGSPPGVQPYINDVPVQINAATTFYDLKSVQAVKGPQGTLFGRNSTGGAVLFQTKEPGDEFGGYAAIQYGNLDRLIAVGATDIPISEKIKVRLAGTVTSGGAWVRNLYDNKEIGDREESSGRMTVSLKPTDSWSNLTTLQRSSAKGTSAPNTIYYTIPCGQPSGSNSCLFHPSVPAFQDLLAGDALQGYPSGFVYPGGFESLPEFLRSQGDYVVDADASFSHEASSDLAINKTEVALSEGLLLKNIFSYSKSRNAINYDTDYSPYPIVQQYDASAVLAGEELPVETGRWKSWSNELQLLGNTDKFDYLLGLFYIDVEEDYFSPLAIYGITPPDTVHAPLTVAYNAVTGNESYAVFGQGTYALTEHLNLTAGARYTWEIVTLKQGPESLFRSTVDASSFDSDDLRQRVTQQDPSWTVSLDYHLTDDLMIYGTTRGSWRRGGFNPFNPPTPTPLTAAAGDGGNYFLPEKVRDVELGMKFDGVRSAIPMRANLALYNSWVENIQKTAYVVIGGTVSSATVNVPKTEIKGVEFDVQVEPAQWLRLGASLAYTHARFTEPDSLLFGNTVTYGPFGDAPKWSGTVSSDSRWKLTRDAGQINWHIDAFSQSSFYFSNLGGTIQPGTKLPSYTLVNMRLDWDDMFGSNLKTSLFAKNLFDKLYYTGGSAGAQNFSEESATFGLPRTYGVQLRVDF